MRRYVWLAVVFAILLGGGALVAQQAYYGSIVGNVTDQTGALVPGAEVTVINVGTGVPISLKTNEQGLYQALNLTPGRYTVRVTLSGFKTFIREGIELGGGQQVRVDGKLEVGAVTESVEVREASPQINTENPTTTLPPITHFQIVTLPKTSFSPACPGCDWPFPDVYFQLWTGNADVIMGAYTVGGAQWGQHALVDDGLRTEGVRGAYADQLTHPGIEAVSEMIVTTSNPSAKFHNPAAVELVTKSGTNEWHGSGWWQHGNKALNARDYFSHQKRPFLLNQYGGSLGGPIVKDKTFFFSDYQGFKFAVNYLGLRNVPTVKMKQGDLSELLDPDYIRRAGFAAPIQIVDPLTGQPFPNNRIPADRISPVAKNILALYPDPDYDSGRGFYSNFQGSTQSYRGENAFDVRVDHYFTPTQHLYGRFTYFDSPNTTPVYVMREPFRGGDWLILKGRILTAHHTSTLTPGLLNHVMFGYVRNRWPTGSGRFEEKFIAWNRQVGIAGIPEQQDNGLALITFSSGFARPESWGKSDYVDGAYQIQDDITWRRGRHAIQAGFDFRRQRDGNSVQSESWPGYCQFGCISFNGRWSNFDFADFLLGLPLSATRQILPPVDFRVRKEWAGYIQDDIKWTPRLSVSLGLRYSYFPVIRSENDMQALFDPATNQLVLPSQKGVQAIPAGTAARLPIPVTTASTVGLPSSLLRSDKNDWQPRLGIAYRFMKDSVLRAGAGVYHTPLISTGRSLLTGPFAVTEDFPAAQPPAGGAPVLALAAPYQVSGLARALINFFAPEVNLKTDLHYDFNLAVEHQIGANALTVEYAGKRSIIPYNVALNAVPASPTPFSRSRLPFPALGSVAGLRNGAHYQYDAFRINARRTFTRGLFFETTYVFSKTIDDSGGVRGEAAGGPEDPFNRARDRGISSFQPANRLTVNYIWEMPFGRSRFAIPGQGGGIRFLNYLVKGWMLGSTYNFQGGGRLTPSGSYINAQGQAYDAPNTNRLSGRPDVTGQSITPTSEQQTQGYIFNPNAFSRLVPAGRYGTAGMTLIPAPGKIDINLSFFRNLTIPKWFLGNESANLRIGVLVYNAINHSNTPGPVVSLNSPLFGKRSSDKSGDTRMIGLQARIDF